MLSPVSIRTADGVWNAAYCIWQKVDAIVYHVASNSDTRLRSCYMAIVAVNVFFSMASIMKNKNSGNSPKHISAIKTRCLV